MSLFDLAPKDSRRALFGRDSEFETLVRLIENGRWSAILGPRMVGKTSLVKAAVRQTRRPNIYVNLWGVSRTQGLVHALIQGLKAKQPLPARLRDLIHRVEGVTVAGAGVSLARHPRPLSTASELIHAIGEEIGAGVVILDEVQELANVAGPLQKLLANVFNTHPKLTFVLTGSYFGLLRTLLEPTADSPMFGRPPAEIELNAFERETSIEFLERGFREHNLRFDRNRLGSVVDRSLDGIPGWLTLFGNSVAVQRLSLERAEQASVREGKRVARSELKHFLEQREVESYWAALRALTAQATWSELRDALSSKRGTAVNDNTVNHVIHALRDARFVTESGGQYMIRDPMVRAYVRDSREPP